MIPRRGRGRPADRVFPLRALFLIVAQENRSLRWNAAVYQQFCPLVLSEETCASRYHELDEETQELLRGALAIQADVTCSECSNGIDLNKTERSVDLFAELLLANCAQTSELVRQVSRKAPGSVFSYPDLWRLTLANYNAGPGCLQEALSEVKRARDPFDWSTVSQALADLEACSGSIEYVVAGDEDILLAVENPPRTRLRSGP